VSENTHLWMPQLESHPHSAGAVTHSLASNHLSVLGVSQWALLSAVLHCRYADCNQLVSDGCEVNILTDTKNCGACNITVSVPNAPDAFCFNGKPFFTTCSPG
jgi:hypothetical protein